MNNSQDQQKLGSPNKLLGKNDQFLEKMEKIVGKIENQCKESGGTKIFKSTDDLPKLLISLISDILNYGLSLEQYEKFKEIPPSKEDNFYSIYSKELTHLNSIKYIGTLPFANTDKKKCMMWLLIEIEAKTLNLTLRDVFQNEKIFSCYSESSLMKVSRTQIKKIISNLESLPFVIEGDVILRFKKFHQEQEDKEMEKLKQKQQEKIQQQQKALQPISEIITTNKSNNDLQASSKSEVQTYKHEPSTQSDIQKPYPQISMTTSFIQHPNNHQNDPPQKLQQSEQYQNNINVSPKPYNGDQGSHKENKTNNEVVQNFDNNFPTQWVAPIQKKPNQLLSLFNQAPEQPKQDQNILPVHLTQKWKHNGKKPSATLYEEIYKEIVENTHSKFKERPVLNQTISEQGGKCWSCQKSITNGFYSIGANCEYCLYSGKWHCNDCLSDQRMPIPWKALETFDLKHYKVCQYGYDEISKLYDVPLLEIDYNDPVVQKSKTLFEFMVLRRQIHLMYDMMCDPNLMQSLLENRMNLCLRQNLFSLKNLYDIYNGSLYKLLEGFYNILSKHVVYCKSCQKRGQVCKICQSISVVQAFDIRNVTYCEKCNNMFHRNCLDQTNCPYCLVANK